MASQATRASLVRAHPPLSPRLITLPPSDIVKTTLRHDGIRGMYRGLGPTVLGYLPTWAIYFAVYDGIKRHFGEPPLGDIRRVSIAASARKCPSTPLSLPFMHVIIHCT